MIRSLTSFRFITALVVFLFHCRIHFGWEVGFRFIDKFFLNGATFMTGFFVLSGFVMAHVYNHTDFSKRENILGFYLKRFAKIYPAYAFVSIAYFILLHDYSLKQILRVFVNDPFLVQGFFPSMFSVGINGGTWSLTVEMLLYFLFPFLMLLSAKSPRILIASIIIAFLASFNVYMDKSDYIYANPIMRISDFMCGMGLYFLRERFSNIKYAGLLQVAIIILLICISRKSGSDQQYMLGHFAIVPLFGAWIAMVYHSGSKVYNNRTLEYLGLISYSFYLWQFVAIELGKKMIGFYPNINILVVVIAAFLINVIIAAVSHKFLEEKVRKIIIARFA